MTDNFEQQPDSSNQIELEGKKYSDEEVTKILQTAKSIRQERKEVENRNRELESQLSKFKNIDPQRYEELQKLAEQREEKELENAKKYEEIKSKWSSEKSDYLKQINSLQSKMQEDALRRDLEKSYYANGGRLEEEDGISTFDLIYNQAKRYIQRDQEGKVHVIDPKDGTPLRTEKGEPYDFNQLMAKFKNAKTTSSLFQAENNISGGGMNPYQGFGSKAGVTVISKSDINALSQPNIIERLAKGDPTIKLI